jgi:hypothetical protein
MQVVGLGIKTYLCQFFIFFHFYFVFHTTGGGERCTSQLPITMFKSDLNDSL